MNKKIETGGGLFFHIRFSHSQKEMDDFCKRRKKKDKAKEKKDRNGGLSTKHVRISEAIKNK